MKPSIIPIPSKITYLAGCSKVTDQTEVYYSLNNSIESEGYELAIENNRVLISYSDERGKFYALQTLKQIIATCEGVCENLTIEDKPRFKYRGFHLDCCRHFFNVEETKKIIDVAAAFKMNVFHWHLTDDQGWRMPISKHPLLTEIGGKRHTSAFGGVIEEGEYCYYFTKDEIVEIIKYCEERFITVIPEIEMPGHSTSVLATYPDLGCTGEEIKVQIKEGIFDTVLCLGNEKTYEFLYEVLDEVCEIFPSKYIHIGGDEAPRTKWKECEKCKKKAADLGVKNFDEFQGVFINHIAEYLAEKGKVAITWNESLKGGKLSTENIIVQRWMDKKGLSYDFANRGGKIIESEFYRYYLDYPYGMTPVSKTYNYRPISKKIKDPTSVIGIEGEIWTEYIRDFDRLCYQTFPRLLAICESAWSIESNKNYKEFTRRHEALRNYTESYGITIPDVSEWSMPPIARLRDIIKFFKGSINTENIRNLVNKDDK